MKPLKRNRKQIKFNGELTDYYTALSDVSEAEAELKERQKEQTEALGELNENTMKQTTSIKALTSICRKIRRRQNETHRQPTTTRQRNRRMQMRKQKTGSVKSKHRASRGRTGGISGIVSGTTTTRDRCNEQRVNNARKRTKRTVLTDGHVRGVRRRRRNIYATAFIEHAKPSRRRDAMGAEPFYACKQRNQ